MFNSTTQKPLTDTVALVTGAASGLGKALALRAARYGAQVILVDRDAEGLEHASIQIRADGGTAQSFVFDLAMSQNISQLVTLVNQQYTQLNLLINNAGYCISGGIERQKRQDIEHITMVNQLATVYLCRELAPLLRQSQPAQVINISSALGLIGAASQSTYSMTKFAVRGFSEALRSEWKEAGIGVTVVYPGAINTNIVKNANHAEPQTQQELEFAQRYFARKGMQPDKAARKILRGAMRNTARIRITPETYLIDWAARGFPGGFQDLAAWVRYKYRQRKGKL